MTVYYSPSTNGFYDTDFAEYKLPSDVVEITKNEHQAIFEQQAAGKVIKAGHRVSKPEPMFPRIKEN